MQKFLEKINEIQKTVTPVSLDNAFYLQLTEGCIKFDFDGNCTARYTFKGCTEELYKLIDELLPKIIGKEYSVLQFDISVNDIKVLQSSVLTVFELNKAVSQEVHKFNVAVGTDDGDGKNLPSYNKFCSTYLHYRFPHSFIPFDLKTYGKSKRLFYIGECNLDGYIVSEDIKQELFNLLKRVFDILGDKLKTEGGGTSNLYVNYCAECYALCVYLHKHIMNEGLNVIMLATEIFKNIEVKR